MCFFRRAFVTARVFSRIFSRTFEKIASEALDSYEGNLNEDDVIILIPEIYLFLILRKR